MWDTFIEACGIHYIPHDFLPVGEQLLAFRGRCPFRMYIPNKPAKYGIKIVIVNDVKNKYMLSGIPYLGKQETWATDMQNLGYSFTKDLTQLYHNQQECNKRQLVYLCAPHPEYAAQLWNDADCVSQWKQVRDTRRDEGQDHTGSRFQCLSVHNGHETCVVCAQHPFQQENCPPHVFNAWK
ncbi:unnamed protein product [Acanthosepion pharaonis]|uniref:PiggyBac transposable element-derived protein domain-containing protein n=1 Tax=Acanthosepion pharaonis TaxID=158019 RepID=A0A812AJ52_ACAPH|nr:unnamed protein product [Sepia pharaonis]